MSSPATRVQAIAAFESLGLCQQLAEAAAELGWRCPSNVQQQAVPLLLQGQAPSESSNTLMKKIVLGYAFNSDSPADPQSQRNLQAET